MKTVRKIGRYELQADKLYNCQIFDTETGKVSARMNRFMSYNLKLETDEVIENFASSVFTQPY